MKTIELITSALMTFLGLWLVWAYASEGKALFALCWAGIAALNFANAALKAVVVWAERS
jgi:hypothetical protein